MPTKKLSEVPVAPSKVAFWSTATGKVLRASVYLAISAGLGGVMAGVADRPDLFGIFTPIINVVLVAAKNYFDPKVKNI